MMQRFFHALAVTMYMVCGVALGNSIILEDYAPWVIVTLVALFLGVLATAADEYLGLAA